MSNAVGSGSFRWDRASERFVGKVTLGAFEYTLTAAPAEDADGRLWRVTLSDGRPYGPYRIPIIDDVS